MTVDRSTPSSPHSPRPHLVCRGCGATVPARRAARLLRVFGPLEVGYDAEALGRVTREQIEAGPQNIWRYAAAAAGRPATRPRGVTLDPGLTPLVRADVLAARARHPRAAVGEGRLGQPDPLVQGPGRVGRADRGARRSASPGSPARRPATWPTRSPPHAARAGVPSIVFIPADLEPGKIVTTAVYGGDAGRDRGLLRRRQPAVLGADRDRRVRGHRVRQRQRPAVLRRGLQDPRGTRWPSSWAGGCPAQVVIPMA